MANYGNEHIISLGKIFGQDKENADGINCPALLNSGDLQSEWVMFKQLMLKYKKLRFQEFWEMILLNYAEGYPNISTLATILLTWPQSSVNVERGFSRQNLVKTDLRSTLTVSNLDRILMVKIEGPNNIENVNWDEMFERWSMKRSRRILYPKILQKTSVN